ncbi:MAG TPA: acetate--CoA ligase family protein [Thermomicrobiales bacterium]|nr:acetate--CoA ligase family protein [Thermomicrobiales bacterium]
MVTPQIGEKPKRGGEAVAFRQAMDALFHPKSIAIVGASQRPGFANSIQRLILKGGYEGAVYGVNPRYDEVMGCPSYPTIDAIPGGVDKAIVVVPSGAVMDVLGQAERAGVKAVNIITSGFGEQADEDAAARQRELRAFADRTGIRIVGPNCLGIISTPAKMIAKSGPYTHVHRGPIGIVFQSGLLAYSAVIPPTDRGFGYSYVVTTGNEADLDATDFMRYYVEDDETRVIGCFIEQFRDAEKLQQVATLAADAGKPLVVLKIGRSEGGQRAARAHTGSLVGSDGVIDAVMRKEGIVRVYNLDEMIETLAVFHSRKLPKANGVGTIFVSGGAGGLISDLSQDLGVNLPELAPDIAERLHDIIPPYGTVGNPLDTTGQVAQQPEIMAGVLQAMAEDPNINTVIYGQAYPNLVDLDSPVGRVMKEIPDKYPDKIFLILSLVAGKMQEGYRADIPPVEPVSTWDGIPFLQGAENGLRAVRALNWYADFQRQRATAPAADAGDSPVAEQARSIVRAAGWQPLVEREAKKLLALYDIPVTGERLATSADAAVAAAREIGYPVGLKIESPDIAHKTEAGGVLLDIDGDDAVRDGYAKILAAAKAYDADARISGVLVQQMVKGGREVILGMTQDPTFGPAVAVGLGGIFVEILKDVVLGAPPLTAGEGREMLGRLRGRAILEGARGAAPADLDAVAGIIAKFSRLCLDLRDEVAEIDINPLLVFDEGRGACVVDCLIVPSAATGAGEQNGAA